MKDMKIIYVAGLHGDEKAPAEALSGAGMDFILGNPEAYGKNVRFTEKDLNASFGLMGVSLEERRARQLLDEIDESVTVVDFHTTSSDTAPFAIVVDQEMIPLAKKTGLGLIVLMSHNIKEGHALINYRKGISVESGRHGTAESRETTLRVVENMKSDEEFPAKVYEVYDKITVPGEYVNFQMHPEGFIPVLAGEEAYEFFGLKAREV